MGPEGSRLSEVALRTKSGTGTSSETDDDHEDRRGSALSARSSRYLTRSIPLGVPPKVFNSIVLALAMAAGLLLLEPWGGSDRSEAEPGEVAALTQSQSERDRVAARQGYYPPAPSTAGEMSPKWREFAAQVDRICAVTYNQMMASMGQVEVLGKRRGWSEERVEEARMQISANQGPQIVHFTEQLGKPPGRADLFYRWRAMVARRAAIRDRAATAAGDGEWREYHRLCDRNILLKERGDVIGQRYGLQICTSN